MSNKYSPDMQFNLALEVFMERYGQDLSTLDSCNKRIAYVIHRLSKIQYMESFPPYLQDGSTKHLSKRTYGLYRREAQSQLSKNIRRQRWMDRWAQAEAMRLHMTPQNGVTNVRSHTNGILSSGVLADILYERIGLWRAGGRIWTITPTQTRRAIQQNSLTYILETRSFYAVHIDSMLSQYHPYLHLYPTVLDDIQNLFRTLVLREQ